MVRNQSSFTISNSVLQIKQRQCIDCKCVWSQYVIFRTNTSCSECYNVSFVRWILNLASFEVQTGVMSLMWWKPRYSIFISTSKRYWTSSTFWQRCMPVEREIKAFHHQCSEYDFMRVCVANVYCLWGGMARRLDAKCRWWCELVIADTPVLMCPSLTHTPTIKAQDSERACGEASLQMSKCSSVVILSGYKWFILIY